MTRAQQRKFVRELIGNISTEILNKVDRIPEHWDGHEIRRWIADHFDASVSRSMNGPHSARMRSYKNDVLIHNL